MNIRKTINAILVIASILAGYYLISHSANTIATPAHATGDKIMVYYFHGDFRCRTCTLIEALTRKAVAENFKKEVSESRLEFKAVNIDKAANAHFVKDYNLETKSVIVAQFNGSKQTRWKNLPKIWEYYSDESAFLKYIRAEINKYLKK